MPFASIRLVPLRVCAARSCFSQLKPSPAARNLATTAPRSLQQEATHSTPVKWSATTVDLVNRLRDQQKYYATVVIKGRPFTVTQNDVVVMDRIKDLELGDALALNQVTELGSRDYTIKGRPYVDPSLYRIEATVIEHPDGKQFTVVKKKQRTASQKTTYHRNYYTMLRISLIDVNKIQ
ncbi:hypothetical protein LPJ78_004508 [Coemansia sp. RSA 989]|nr:ribosomal protein L21-like protein [Coemansia mojavensis]KAJ1738633.1 hypothetical protein LPJ68_005386 [Coemansia sp. RSA 1086]KAJ1747068.1 hypothetical protein LPJ79_005514 [Coemansia sp. RSA 1821]KAJ1862739.1 hypothetical protein LPJ78_004508 [Coemansia sp. RSA 989]KAJ1871257.1 hypothetical protein LPJ55_004044 [Coemansia sp. RSA 990]KAJ2627684.1 hypothetical protein H4R22_004279 [Coemansia sp. RSA 1290]KAJ2651179.1 hypothetical protein IWW40_001950 [Coemansia sp. RSA 1250]KAJ2673015.1